MQARPPQGPIQKTPLGLLEWLGLKQSGETPNSLLGSVQGTIDVQQFYLANSRKHLFASAPVAGTTNGLIAFTVPNAVVVPANELWIISRGHVAFGVSTPDSIAYLGVAQVYANGTRYTLLNPLAGPFGAATALGAGRTCAATLSPGMILRPGYELRAFVCDFVGGAAACELYLDYNVIPI